MPSVITLAADLCRNEPRRWNGARLAAVTTYLWARFRLGRIGGPITVSATTQEGPVAHFKVWTWIDMLVVRELFVRGGDYRLPADLTPATILDIGANIGVSVAYFRARFPSSLVIAVEPDPVLFVRLRANVLDDSNVLLLEAAATHVDGPVPFYCTREGWSSSLEPRSKAISERRVEGMTVGSILSWAGATRVDLVKMDIEGGEWDILDSGALLEVTDCVVGELHHNSTERTTERAARCFADWSLAFHKTLGPVTTFTALRDGQ